MRDPNRIDEICNRLKVAWKQVPDMRLGQLLENAGVGFYTEDKKAIEFIEAFVWRVSDN